MVLPGRIELTTSPLPRGCSTTELRQQESGAVRSGAPKRAETAIRDGGVQGSSGPRSRPDVAQREIACRMRAPPAARAPAVLLFGVGLAPGPPGSLSPLP
jgi:hypothetical protein